MPPLTLRTHDGTTLLQEPELDDLARRLEGDLLRPDHPDYDEERTIWNGMIDRRPGLVVRARATEDVVEVVRFAARHRLLLSVRGAGHNIAGKAVCDGGLLLSLAHMRRVTVDAGAHTAHVQPGATLGDLDTATQVRGLATPVGINSTTGIAGLTLGGGFGWLSRKHGMTIDNLISAEVVLPSGERTWASAVENPDLFWALRGGGGNFGIVTSFQFRLHPVGPQVLSGLVVHPFERAAEVLRFYRSFADTLPDEAAVWVVMRKAPPLPFLPEEWHGREVVVLAAFYAGDLEEGERVLRPLREFGEPIADVISPHQYRDWQSGFDPLLLPGARNYWKSHDFLALSDPLLDIVVEHVHRLPSPGCEVFFAQLGGAMGRVAPDATAYPHRSTRYVMNLHARWEDPAEDAACVGWARELFAATAPHATGGVYVNFMPEDEGDRVRMAYGSNYDRLVGLKQRFDPQNLLRQNQNIRPVELTG